MCLDGQPNDGPGGRRDYQSSHVVVEVLERVRFDLSFVSLLMKLKQQKFIAVVGASVSLFFDTIGQTC
jgi:hypothetical protein